MPSNPFYLTVFRSSLRDCEHFTPPAGSLWLAIVVQFLCFIFAFRPSSPDPLRLIGVALHVYGTNLPPPHCKPSALALQVFRLLVGSLLPSHDGNQDDENYDDEDGDEGDEDEDDDDEDGDESDEDEDDEDEDNED